VTEFDVIKTDRLGLPQKGGAVGGAVGMPACGEGEGRGRHGFEFR
jgi:hypothetical protein